MVTITLPSELERAVAEEAARSGTTAELLTLDVLQQRFLNPSFAIGSTKAVPVALLEQLLDFLRLPQGWNGYDASPPNHDAVATATAALIALQELPWPPDRVAPSAVGGVGITYRRGSRKAYVECYNSGQAVLLLSNADAEQLQTRAVNPTIEGFSLLPSMIRE